jgi:hypothetical protein
MLIGDGLRLLIRFDDDDHDLLDLVHSGPIGNRQLAIF